MLQREHSAILSTFIKLPDDIKTFVLSIFKLPFYTGFTVLFHPFMFSALQIHCSAQCKALLDALGGYTLQERGFVPMKVSMIKSKIKYNILPLHILGLYYIKISLLNNFILM